MTSLATLTLITVAGCGSSDQGVMASDEEAKKAAEIAAQDVNDTENVSKKPQNRKSNKAR